jgi:glycogen synthase
VRAGLDVGHGDVIYAPVDVQSFDGMPKPAGVPLSRLLWVGRLCPEKGIRTALEAIARLGATFQGHLDVYGRGEPSYVAGLHAFVREHRLPVTFSAARPEEMPAVYRAHDALLFTSEWPEPFAVTPLEGMASGLPVVATTTGGSAELFRHGDNALTYTAGDARELAERVHTLIADPALRVGIATRGRADVRAAYAEDLIVDQIEVYLEATVEAWRPPALAPAP